MGPTALSLLLVPPTSGALVRTTPIFKIGFYADLNYNPVKFPDCILHSYDAIKL